MVRRNPSKTHSKVKETQGVKLAKIAIIVILVAGLLYVLPLDEILDRLDIIDFNEAPKTVELNLYIVESLSDQTEELNLHLE